MSKHRLDRIERLLSGVERQEKGSGDGPAFSAERAAEVMGRLNLSEEARRELRAAAAEGRPADAAILRAHFDLAEDTAEGSETE
jgi:hypothetical protein